MACRSRRRLHAFSSGCAFRSLLDLCPRVGPGACPPAARIRGRTQLARERLERSSTHPVQRLGLQPMRPERRLLQGDQRLVASRSRQQSRVRRPSSVHGIGSGCSSSCLQARPGRCHPAHCGHRTFCGHLRSHSAIRRYRRRGTGCSSNRHRLSGSGVRSTPALVHSSGDIRRRHGHQGIQELHHRRSEPRLRRPTAMACHQRSVILDRRSTGRRRPSQRAHRCERRRPDRRDPSSQQRGEHLASSGGRQLGCPWVLRAARLRLRGGCLAGCRRQR